MSNVPEAIFEEFFAGISGDSVAPELLTAAG